MEIKDGGRVHGAQKSAMSELIHRSTRKSVRMNS